MKFDDDEISAIVILPDTRHPQCGIPALPMTEGSPHLQHRPLQGRYTDREVAKLGLRYPHSGFTKQTATSHEARGAELDHRTICQGLIHCLIFKRIAYACRSSSNVTWQHAWFRRLDFPATSTATDATTTTPAASTMSPDISKQVPSE